jgi:hypothetical protein
VVPATVFDKLSDDKKTGLQSSKWMFLCEDHFAVEMYNCPSDKGKYSICSMLFTLVAQFLCVEFASVLLKL